MAVGTTIWTWFDNEWVDGNPAVMRAADHGTWLGTLVFDGARAHQGKVPDLDRHCARVNASAIALGLNPTLGADEMQQLVHEGLAKFSAGASVYIRPMYWSASHGDSVIVADPDSTVFCLCLEELGMPPATAAQTLAVSSFVRPLLTMATVNAKAACLYPNNARMIREAHSKGFTNALVTDALGNVAETASANIFMVKDGVVMTPIPNGTFLNGVTRQRVIELLRSDGQQVLESVLSVEDFLHADEVFMSGNITKITPVTAIEASQYPHGPVTQRARALYWEWAGFTD